MKNLAIDFDKAAQYILSQQNTDGSIPWYQGNKLDPWDHTEAAMALSIAKQPEAAVKAYQWLAEQQLSDGSWYAHYFSDSDNSQALKETNFIAYIATGIWHHFLISNDKNFLNRFFPMVERAISCVLRFQTKEGDIAWAINSDNQAENDALLTACASILRSLECAILSARTLNKEISHWEHCWQALYQTISHKPHRFDRTWESKARFAMDWYYPVLAGIYSPEKAKEILQQRWHEFVDESTLGCRCVNDEPWVTMAETAELSIALVAAGQTQKAKALFHTLKQWQDNDGGFWTGYVFRDNTIWPDDKTTWTAGAVILAADAIFQLSPACNLFTQPATIKPATIKVQSK